MTSPEIAAYTALTAKAVAANARRLGLTWTVSPATVESYDFSTGLAVAVLDGDLIELTMTSLTGELFSGDRVMVMTAPPSSNYVIGPVGPQSPRGGIVGFDSSTSSSAAITAETVISTVVTNQNLRAGRCYEIQIVGHYVTDALVTPVLNTMGLLRVRKDNLAGTVALDQRTVVLTPVGFFISQYHAGQFQVTNTGVVTLVLTLASNTVTGVLNLANTTGSLRWIKVVDIGDVDDFSNIRSI